MAKSELLFTHPKVGNLSVNIKPDAITWSYGLNTANYPTYGGEVIQILSCYIEDITIQGTTRSYRQLEKIYKYFIDYIQTATQGKRGTGSFDPRPIRMHYFERQWTFDIHPTQLPSFLYGRDVVAPTWTVVGAVADPDQKTPLKSLIMDKAALDAVRSDGDFKLFGRVTGDIGYKRDDPWRTPFVKSKDVEGDAKNAYGDIGDLFNHLIPAYLEGNTQDLFRADYSRPAAFNPDLNPPSGSGSSGNQGNNQHNSGPQGQQSRGGN